MLQEPPSHFAAVDSDDSEDVKFRVVWEGYRSENSQYGTVILFHNTSNLPIDINWISYSGREVRVLVSIREVEGRVALPHQSSCIADS